MARRAGHGGRYQLRLRLFGTVQLKLLYQSSPQFDAHVVTQELGTYNLEQNGDAPREVVLSIPLETVSAGMVSFSLQAETTGAICYGGSYETIEEPLHPNPVHLALDLCTFRREAFILRNLTMLRKAFLDNPDSPLYGNLSLFIVDNAGTLDAAQLADDAVRVVQNPNTGGSGGFTRGMLEILHAAETLPVTHVLLMDDDILLDPEVLYLFELAFACRSRGISRRRDADTRSTLLASGVWCTLELRQYRVLEGRLRCAAAVCLPAK